MELLSKEYAMPFEELALDEAIFHEVHGQPRNAKRFFTCPINWQRRKLGLKPFKGTRKPRRATSVPAARPRVKELAKIQSRLPKKTRQLRPRTQNNRAKSANPKREKKARLPSKTSLLERKMKTQARLLEVLRNSRTIKQLAKKIDLSEGIVRRQIKDMLDSGLVKTVDNVEGKPMTRAVLYERTLKAINSASCPAPKSVKRKRKQADSEDGRERKRRPKTINSPTLVTVKGLRWYGQTPPKKPAGPAPTTNPKRGRPRKKKRAMIPGTESQTQGPAPIKSEAENRQAILPGKLTVNLRENPPANQEAPKHQRNEASGSDQTPSTSQRDTPAEDRESSWSPIRDVNQSSSSIATRSIAADPVKMEVKAENSEETNSQHAASQTIEMRTDFQPRELAAPPRMQISLDPMSTSYRIIKISTSTEEIQIRVGNADINPIEISRITKPQSQSLKMNPGRNLAKL